MRNWFLQQLAHAADAAVAQMVDIIGGANIVAQTAWIRSRSTASRSARSAT